MSLELLVLETHTAISSLAKDGALGAGEVIQIAVALSQKLQKLTDISGSEKKAFLMSTMKNGLEDSIHDPSPGFIDALLSATSVSIDIILSAASGKLDLRKPSSWTQCIPICIGFLKMEKAKSPLTGVIPQ
jgi:hypothetical protein